MCVKVYIGTMDHWYACIRYEDELNVALIVALVVLLGVPFILLVIVAIIYICKRCCCREEETTDKENEFEFMTVVPRRPSVESPGSVVR